MLVYVASKFEEKERVQKLYEELRAAGHTITHDWTGETDGPDKTDAYFAKCAKDDVDGVLRAEALVILPHEKGKGLYVEMGVAFAREIPIVCWHYDGDLPNCIFFKHADVIHVYSEQGILDALREIAHYEEHEAI